MLFQLPAKLIGKIALAVLLMFAGQAQAHAQTLGLRRAYADALTFPFPVEMLPSNDGTGRMFVVSQNGIISVFPNVSTTSSAQTFLNIGASPGLNRIVFNSNEERGLLGMALHPNFRNNRQFFLYYTTVNPGNSRTVMVVARYEADPNNANLALTTETRLLTFEKNQDNTNHNGGKIAFGPDGFLYLSIGDGGGGNDPARNAQNRTNLFGKILRIDVDGDDFPADANRNYRIPASNPFQETNERPEIYALGIRNTWKFTFDRVTGQLWGADVGQGNREEINIITRGANYGWVKYEGTRTNFANEPEPVPTRTMPIFEYEHAGVGASITGGYVYRGTSIPGLEGRYVYGDFQRGTLASLSYSGTTASNTNHLTPARDPVSNTTINIASFGQDEQGELYLLGRNTGRVYRLTNTAQPPVGQAVAGIGRWAALASGTDGLVRAVATDANGNVFVAGSFNTAGGVAVNNIARWNPTTGWSALGSGLSGTVNTLLVQGTEVIAGGTFSNAGSTVVNNLARWDGANWQAIGNGTDGPVRALAANGSDLFVAGNFTQAGGNLANNIARWNGTAWNNLGGGTNNEVRSLVFSPGQQALFVGGNFTLAGSTTVQSIARWSTANGWQALGSGLAGFASALTLLPNGDLIAGGSFTTAGGNPAERVARWNGTVWSALVGGVDGPVSALAVTSTGNLLVGGLFSLADGKIVNNVAFYNPAAGGWLPLGPGTTVGTNSGVLALATVGNLVYAGGGPTTAGNLSVNNLAQWEMPYLWNNAWVPSAPTAQDNVEVISTSTSSPTGFVAKDLAVRSGVTLSVATGQTVTVNGNLDYSGATIEVLTGGAFVQTTTSTSVTSTAASRFRVVRSDAREAIGYNFVASPVGGERINSIGTNTYPNARFRYAPGVGWSSVAADELMAPGTGYAYVPAAAPNNGLTFENTADGSAGRPGNGLVEVPLAFSGNRFNLIGNPYPSPIGLAAFLTANASTTTGTAWFWRDNNNATGSGNYLAFSGVNVGTTQVAVGQGFFVQASASGNATFTNALRAGGNPIFQRSEEVPMTKFRLDLGTGGLLLDELWVAFGPQFTREVDPGYDAQKFEGATHLSLSAVVGDERLAIAALPEVAKGQAFELPLQLYARHAGTYSLAAGGVDNPTPHKLFLEDRQAGEFHYLQPGRAHTLAVPAGTHRGRYFLRSASEVAGQASTSDAAQAYSFGRDLFVEVGEAASVAIYDVLGTQVAQFAGVQPGAMRRLDTRVPVSGVYVVRVATASGTIEKRVWLEK
jgi:glucose/arabinose dehydrogenase